jgi:PDZ domain-containing protein
MMTDATSPPPPTPEDEVDDRRPVSSFRRRWWAWGIFIVVAAAIAVSSRVDLNEYAVTPGTAQSVNQFITVPPSKAHPVDHPVLLVDVEIGRVSALSYLWYKLQGNVAFDSVGSITGGTPPSQLDAQGALQMSQAETAAKTSALRRLGYTVPAHPAGAVVAGTYPGTPAYPLVNVGDVISAVDGVPTLSADALTTQLRTYHSGQTITLTVSAGGTAPPKPVPVTLADTRVDVGGGTYQTLDLGIQVEDQVDYTYPFPVSIDVTNIGGPSAGLAMTLGVMDALTDGSITGGRTVAATGTMDDQGDVGDVGGVPQKTIAVEHAGATLFLVPPQEYRAARSAQHGNLQIYAVSTLDQALAVIAAHGGHVPPLPSPTTTTTTSGVAGG